ELHRAGSPVGSFPHSPQRLDAGFQHVREALGAVSLDGKVHSIGGFIALQAIESAPAAPVARRNQPGQLLAEWRRIFSCLPDALFVLSQGRSCLPLSLDFSAF